MAGKRGDDSFQDDMDVEIVNIDTPELAPTRVSLTPCLPHGRRRWQLVITSVLLIVAIVIVFGSYSPARLAARGLLFGPKPVVTPTLVPGVNLFYIQLDPARGQVLLDGHQLKPLPVIGINQPLSFAPGHHVLQWRDSPFLQQTCTVSVPPIDADTCSYNDSVQLSSGLGAWVIRFQATLTMLPSAQRTALIRTTQSMLDKQETSVMLQPGELYGVLQGNRVALARAPLRATLRFLLDPDPNSKASCIISGSDTGQGCFVIGQDCRAFCPDPTQPVDPSQPSQSGSSSSTSASSALRWDVLGVIRPVWNYSTLHGKLVASSQSDDIGDEDVDEFLQPMQILWDGTKWYVSVRISAADPFGDPTCGTTQDEMRSKVALNPGSQGNFSVEWYYISTPLHAEGCVALALVTYFHPATNAQPVLQKAYFINRFGKMLAANPVAHQLMPNLPLADASEQATAQQMVSAYGPVS